jgi:hypothetical protein
LLLLAADVRGATSGATQSSASPFPLSIVSKTDVRSPVNTLDDFRELTYPSDDLLGSPDLQRMAKRVTWFAFVIAIVCLLIIAYANRRNRRTRSEKGELRVVETISLGPRCFCDLLSVRGQFFVVARDATGLKEMRQVNSFGDAFTATAESSQLSDYAPEVSSGHTFADDTLVSPGVER